jgi:PIN domain nuclease of toxin-antitoxin system
MILGEAETEVVISAVGLWELATKNRLGKWPDAEPVLQDFENGVARSFRALPISRARPTRG